MRDMLADRVRASGYARMRFDYRRFMEAEEYRRYRRLTIGTLTITDTIGREKYIDHSIWPMSSWELARAYLGWIWEEQKSEAKERVPWNTKTRKYLALNPPRYFTTPTRGRLAYVDLRRAFFQIYAPATLDLGFVPERRSAVRGRVEFLRPDFLASEKLIANSVVGITRAWRMNVWDGRKIVPQKNWNRFLAPELWCYIALTLHHVALDIMRYWQVHYVNSDGYIVDERDAERVVEYLRREWGLEAAVDARGRGEVWGFVGYRIGAKESKTIGWSSREVYLMPDDRSMSSMTQWMKRVRWWLLEQAGGEGEGVTLL